MLGDALGGRVLGLRFRRSRGGTRFFKEPVTRFHPAIMGLGDRLGIRWLVLLKPAVLRLAMLQTSKVHLSVEEERQAAANLRF